jgi:putative toxin-antitoxin system antitoxin component (TIGR02293 family)
MLQTPEQVESSSERGLYSRLQDKLGASGIRSGDDLVDLVEKRLPASTVKALVHSGLTDLEAFQLILPRRTLAHRLANRERLSKDESDKAVRVARITALAELVFGKPERAWRWMRKPKRRFHGKTPIELLASEAGARMVEEMIYQIDDGMAA